MSAALHTREAAERGATNTSARPDPRHEVTMSQAVPIHTQIPPSVTVRICDPARLKPPRLMTD